MRLMLFFYLFAILTIGVFAQSEATGYTVPAKANFPSYDEAVRFAEILNRAGFKVNKIARSKLEGFFRGVDEAAYYKTDRGVLEAIFFPNDGAEKIQVVESRDGNRYIYSFTGQPEPKPTGDGFNSSKPMNFISHGNAFVVVWDNDGLFRMLKACLPKR